MLYSVRTPPRSAAMRWRPGAVTALSIRTPPTGSPSHSTTTSPGRMPGIEPHAGGKVNAVIAFFHRHAGEAGSGERIGRHGPHVTAPEIELHARLRQKTLPENTVGLASQHLLQGKDRRHLTLPAQCVDGECEFLQQYARRRDRDSRTADHTPGATPERASHSEST